MKKRRKNLRPKVLFNASVILAGLNSPKGGSAKTAGFAKSGKIRGIISEVTLDEVLRHCPKFDFDPKTVTVFCLKTFEVVPAPKDSMVRKYSKKVIDEGDAHVLASCEEAEAKYLVTLDKRHLLILRGKIKGLKIVTPGDLIKSLEAKK